MTDMPLEHLVTLPVPSPAPPSAPRWPSWAAASWAPASRSTWRRRASGTSCCWNGTRSARGRRRSRSAGCGDFSEPGNIVLGQRSLEAFERFDQRVPDGHRTAPGRLPVPVPERAEADAVAQSAELQNRMGGRTRLIDPDEAATLNPYLDPRALVCASFSPRDGYARPARVVAGYRAAAEELEVRGVVRARRGHRHRARARGTPRAPHQLRHAGGGDTGHRGRRLVAAPRRDGRRAPAGRAAATAHRRDAAARASARRYPIHARPVHDAVRPRLR